jgi:hypothetical protein
MPVAIEVEDGSGVENANSFIDVAFARAYASNRGVALSSDDDLLGAMLIQAGDYLNAYECEYQGKRVDCGQAMCYPRSGVVFCCEDWPDDEIPGVLKQAQAALVMAVNAGIVLFPNISATDLVVREKIGPIETEYANPLQANSRTRITSVDALLAPLFGSCQEQGSGFRVMRV